MFTAVLFITAEKYKQFKCSPTTERINKMHIRRTEYNSAIRRNGLLMHVTIWINLKNIMLNKRNQIQKTTHYMTLLK